MSYFYKLKKIKSENLVIYHHLGLGDHIICAGLINYLSETFKNIHLPVKKHNAENIRHLFSHLQNVHIFNIEKNEGKEVDDYAKKNNLPVLKLGFEKMKDPFDMSFYKQIKLPYSISYDYFHLVNDKKQEKNLKDFVLNFYNISNSKFILIHNETSLMKYDLRIQNSNSAYVSKESDKFGNIFLYKRLIEDAEEIHCVNSSFLHLVERVETNAKLYYHQTRFGPLSLKKDWKVLKYEN